MALLKVVTAPDPILLTASNPVSEVNDDLRKFLEDMVETMYEDHGVGLAAVQVGVAKQIIVIDLKEDDDQERPEGFYPLYLINPQITWSSEECINAGEGCLSVPTLRIEVVRPSEIKLRYLDYNGQPQFLEANGWLSRVIQHEMDHLKGKLIIDYLSPLKKELANTKLKKLKKQLA